MSATETLAAPDNIVTVTPYVDYRAVRALFHSHLNKYGDDLRAVIAFGDSVTKGDPQDVEVLEVIEGWEGLSQYVTEANDALSLRGKLFLNILAAEDFTCLAQLRDRKLQSLLERILEGYEVIYDFPYGFARDILQSARRYAFYRDSEPLIDPMSLPSVRGEAKA